MTKFDRWTVRFVMIGPNGERHVEAYTLPDEITARRFVDLCRTISARVAASANPLDSATPPAAE